MGLLNSSPQRKGGFVLPTVVGRDARGNHLAAACRSSMHEIASTQSDYPLPRLRFPGWRRGGKPHPLHRHRAADPRIAEMLLNLALERPDLLPRRLPEGRGRAYGHVGVRVDPPPGAYARIPVWRDRRHWATITVAIAIAQHRDVLARHHVSPEMLRRWARAKSGWAWSNGRRCVVRPDTLASVLTCSPRQVQRTNACARELGLEVVVLRGRMLTQAERWQAYDRGSRQRGLATETALTVPRDQISPVDHVTPPRGEPETTKRNCLLGFPHGLTAGSTEAATRPRPQKGRRKGSPSWVLAVDVTRNVPWLRRETPHRLVGVLARYVNCPQRWTGADIAAALNARDRRLQQPTMTEAVIRTRPAVLLAAALQDIHPVVDHPSLQDGPLIPQAPVSCGHPACDGHGWLRGVVDDDGYESVVKCPRCPAQVRAN